MSEKETTTTLPQNVLYRTEKRANKKMDLQMDFEMQ